MVIFQRFSSQGSTESKRSSSAKKKVSFTVEEPNILSIEGHQNKEEIWYTEDDESEFRQRDNQMALLLIGMDPNMVKFKLPKDSTRGLEYAQPEKTKVIEQRRKNSISAVVATQKLDDRVVTERGTQKTIVGREHVHRQRILVEKPP